MVELTMDMIPKIDSFLDVVATALIIITVVYSVIAIFGLGRAIRIGAILLVAALALYSDSFGTYFVAIFIIATAVTELEFLEKLAAIIRGNKDYFDYKKSQVPVDEAKAKADREAAAAIADLSENPESQLTDNLEFKPISDKATKIKLEDNTLEKAGSYSIAGYTIEQLTLTYLENKYAAPIQRNMRYSSPNSTVEFDGVIEKRSGKLDTLFEIKLVARQSIRNVARISALEFAKRKSTFEQITGRGTVGILVFVVTNKQTLNDKLIDSVKLRVQLGSSSAIQFEIVDFKDIGYTSNSPNES